MPEPVKVISAAQLSDAIAGAVKSALASRPGLQLEPDVTLAPPGLIGFVVRGDALAGTSVGDLQNLAASVAQSLPQGGTPAALVHGGHTVVGFVPDLRITLKG